MIVLLAPFFLLFKPPLPERLEDWMHIFIAGILVPPFAAVFGWLLLGEEMPPAAWSGMAVAALGVILATQTRQKSV